ncbi:MAG: ABC transporter permease [Lachnospiraceae bacterium]|nr:ABC transporter permease [Lachnospiraceae bacterium]
MKLFREIYEYRQMIFGLVKRDLRGRYKGSVLGFLWTFLNPLLQLLVYTFLFSTILRSDIDKYYLHLFVALIPWMFFAASVQGGAGCVLNQAGMITKIYFPREVLPIAHVTSQFVNMLYTFVVVMAVVLLAGVFPSLMALLQLPIIMFIEYCLALGLTMLISSVTVYFRDLEYIMGIVTMAWQFLCPVVYSIDLVESIAKSYPWAMKIYMLNPMTPIVLAFRDILYYGKPADLSTLWLAAVLAAICLIVGFAVFGRLKCRFAEEL